MERRGLGAWLRRTLVSFVVGVVVDGGWVLLAGELLALLPVRKLLPPRPPSSAHLKRRLCKAVRVWAEALLMKPCVFSLRRIVGKPLVADNTGGKRERPGMRPIIMSIV